MPYIGNASANRFVASKAATQFSGDGSTTAFTLDHSVGADEDILVSVDGVIQEPSVAYAVSNGTTLTFTAAPSSNSGNNIFVYYLFRTVATVDHPSTSSLQATDATFTGAITANAGVNVDNITIDGTEIDLSSGDLTVDVAGDIILDADGGDVKLKDGGTEFANLSIDNSGLTIVTTASDADFKINGNDGGSTITALTLDMSEAGQATFNSEVRFTQATINSQVSIYTDGSGAEIDNTSGNFTIDTPGNIVLDADGAVTMTKQPAFHAHKNGSSNTVSNFGVNSDIVITWEAERFDQNSDFDLTNNRFVAPVTGKYFLQFQARLEYLDTDATYYYFAIRTSNLSYSYIIDPDYFDSDSVYYPIGFCVLADMDANDTADIIFSQSGGTSQTDLDGRNEYTWFSGHLAC